MSQFIMEIEPCLNSLWKYNHVSIPGQWRPNKYQPNTDDTCTSLDNKTCQLLWTNPVTGKYTYMSKSQAGKLKSWRPPSIKISQLVQKLKWGHTYIHTHTAWSPHKPNLYIMKRRLRTIYFSSASTTTCLSVNSLTLSQCGWVTPQGTAL